MKILADFHHDCLYESLALLFEDRLGYELYRPIGMEWFEQEYWNHERAWYGDGVARQYLEPWDTDHDGIRRNTFHGRDHKLLTLEQARDLKPDLVLSSLAHNHEGYARFAKEVGATFALQVGNVRFSPQDMAEDRWDLADFGLVTSILPGPVEKPHVVYHQEFRLTDYRYEPPPRNDPFRISSFVQCFPENRDAYAGWQLMAGQYPEFDWRVYGAYGSCPTDQWAAGNLDRCADVAAAMRASDVAWHAKQWSDGYGHVFHNWHAVGRPMLGYRDYYKDQLGGLLWDEGVTGWDIGSRHASEVAALLRRFRDDEDFHVRACERVAANFRERVDFDEDAQRVYDLITGIVS